MSEAATTAPPAAPAAAPPVAPPATLHAVAPPKGTHANTSRVTGPAMDRVRAALREKAQDAPAAPATAPAKASPPATPTPTPPAPAKPATPRVEPLKPPTPERAETPEPPVSESTPAPAPAEKPPETPVSSAPPGTPKEKLGPWQMKDRAEKRAKAAEAENAELHRKLNEMGDANVLRDRAERLAKRNAELEETVRHYDYTKSEEYKTKYEQPFTDAWAKAVSDFGELTISEGEEVRRATDKDLYALVNLPLGEARRRATELFGDAAEDAMAHYRKIRDLADEQRRAVDTVKKESVAKAQEREETQRRVSEELGSRWQAFVASDRAKHSFLQPREGDVEWNAKLEQAERFVDQVFVTNAADPKLTPELRAKAVRDQASVRGRAIGFSMLLHENKALKAQLAERDATIASYKQGEPGAGSAIDKALGAPITASNRMDSIRALIRSRANR